MHGHLHDARGLCGQHLVGDGLTVLTEAAPLKDAQEITVAFTDGEVIDGEAQPARRGVSIGVILLSHAHGQAVTSSPEDPAPAVEQEAFAAEAPQSFKATRVLVSLRLVRQGGAPPRWEVFPALPAFYRGGPL